MPWWRGAHLMLWERVSPSAAEEQSRAHLGHDEVVDRLRHRWYGSVPSDW